MNLRSDTEALKDVLASGRPSSTPVRTGDGTAGTGPAADQTTGGHRHRAKARSSVEQLSAPVGLLPLTGRASTVTMTDASPEGNEDANPRRPGDTPAGPASGDQRHVEGRSLGIQVMDQRLINTSAVRCVGNTLIQQGTGLLNASFHRDRRGRPGSDGTRVGTR